VDLFHDVLVDAAAFYRFKEHIVCRGQKRTPFVMR
jgi:hypothetical protein